MSDDNPYSLYYLSDNPFPVVPIPEESPKIFGANLDALQRMTWQLKKVAKSNRPIHIVLVGPYGSGKTHLLRYLSSQVNSCIQGGLGAYVPHPGPDFISIYRRFIEGLSYDKLQKLSKSADERKLKETIVYHDFVTALVNLANPDKTLEAWRWLTANTLTLEERRSLNVATSIEREEEALNAFSALLRFLRSVGFNLICMIIDEFEEINGLVPLQKRKLFNDLRHLIDLNVANFSLIIACTPHGWETLYDENAALVRRFSSNVVFLDPLDEHNATRLITDYLNSTRTEHQALEEYVLSNLSDKDLYSTYPFTKDAIRELCSISKGNSGETLKNSGIAIEQGAKDGHKLLDAGLLRSLIATYYGKVDVARKNETIP